MKPWYSKRERRIRRYFRQLHPEGTLAYSKFYQVEHPWVTIEFLDPIPIAAVQSNSYPIPVNTKKVTAELHKYAFGNWILTATFLLKTETLYIQDFHNRHDRS